MVKGLAFGKVADDNGDERCKKNIANDDNRGLVRPLPCNVGQTLKKLENRILENP
jgi:hypothetical protein